MRYGQNPAKFEQSVHHPADVTVCVVVYIPFLSGYYAQSLDVLKTCLGSIWQNTEGSYDLMVFDNASCQEVREYLQEAQRDGKIQYLVLSEKNIGKTGAWNFIFGAAPGETVVYADADIFFYPGWLPPQLQALKESPKVGMVTGMPIRTPPQFSTATVEWAESEPGVGVQSGKLLSWEDYRKHSLSLGADDQKAREHYDSTEDTCVTINGRAYYVGAGHFQFSAPKAVLQSVLPMHADRPMGQVRQLDIALNERGYLRLSTPDWWIRHMGNTLSGEPAVESGRSTPSAGANRGFWDWKPVRRILLGFYDRIFGIYFRR